MMATICIFFSKMSFLLLHTYKTYTIMQAECKEIQKKKDLFVSHTVTQLRDQNMSQNSSLKLSHKALSASHGLWKKEIMAYFCFTDHYARQQSLDLCICALAYKYMYRKTPKTQNNRNHILVMTCQGCTLPLAYDSCDRP